MRRKLLIKAIARVLPIGYIVLVWYLSSRPSDAVFVIAHAGDAALKESLHLVEFGSLYVLMVFAAAVDGPVSARWKRIALVVAAIYGLIDEVHQLFVPYRSFTVSDLLKDWTGVVVAWHLLNRPLVQRLIARTTTWLSTGNEQAKTQARQV